MKKILVVLTACVLVLTLVACGSGKAKSLDLDRARKEIESLKSYPSLMEPNDTEMKDVYGIDSSLISKKAVGIPMMNVHSSMYWLVLAKDSTSADTLKTQFASYFKGYQEMWDSYLPDQAELVRNRLETTYDTEEGTWLLYAIGEDTAAVKKAVEDALVK
ncbi:MAG: DUF4358 domain-containing protein [Oscillospiraceae bacterium]